MRCFSERRFWKSKRKRDTLRRLCFVLLSFIGYFEIYDGQAAWTACFSLFMVLVVEERRTNVLGPIVSSYSCGG